MARRIEATILAAHTTGLDIAPEEEGRSALIALDSELDILSSCHSTRKGIAAQQRLIDGKVATDVPAVLLDRKRHRGVDIRRRVVNIAAVLARHIGIDDGNRRRCSRRWGWLRRWPGRGRGRGCCWRCCGNGCRN